MKQYVIIGGGVAAVGAIEGIRSVDQKTPIVLISAENHAVYARPLISYYLQGKTDLTRMAYRPKDFYDKNGVTALWGATAEKIDTAEKKVVVSDGQEISYDKVLLATGSAPFVPPMKGLESVTHALTFQTMEDMLALEKLLSPDRRVLIIGAGLIGLKCAEGIAERVASVTVCDLADRVLSSIMDEEPAGRMQRQMEAHGIRFYLHNSVACFDGDRATLQNGETVDFDILVAALGVRPRTKLAVKAGCKVNRGITVDAYSATNIPNVFAAGDCTEYMDITTATVHPMAILPNAYMQGYAAGVNMAGGSECFDTAIPMNSIGFFGLHAMSAGSYDVGAKGKVIEQTDKDHIKRLFIKDDLLKGFMLVGDTQRAGIYTDLVRRQVPLSSLDGTILSAVPSLLPFGRETRAEKLGGEV